MSRRRKHPPPPFEAVITLRLTLRCPADARHPLGGIYRDVVGDHLRAAYTQPVWRYADADNNVPLRRDPPMPRPNAKVTWPNGDTAGRLRWTCPWCVRAGLREDRQVSYARVAELLAAMREARVPQLRVQLDPAELARHVTALRAQAAQHNV
jgi:hypothetical protein